MKANLFIASLLLICASFSQKSIDDTPNYLFDYYINYKDSVVTIDKSWFSKYHFVSDFFSEEPKEEETCYINDSCFNNWLRENDFLNHWLFEIMYKDSAVCKWLKTRGYDDRVFEPDITSQTRSEFLAERFERDSIEYYYIGKCYISDNFDSYQIDEICENVGLPDSPYYFYDRNTYIFNVQGSRLLSIIKTFHYYSYSGYGDSGYEYTTRVAPNTYTCNSVTLSSDVIFADDDWSRKQNDPTEELRYSIDDNGFVTSVSLHRNNKSD